MRGLGVATPSAQPSTHARAQVGFITFLVGPLYKALLEYAPELQPLVAQLEANREHFAAESK